MLLLLAALLGFAGQPASGSLARAADDLVARAVAGEEGGTVALAVAGTDGGLVEPTQTALSAALSRRGQTVVLLRGIQLADPEAEARALRADLFLRVRVSLLGETLTLTGELIPTRPNFFLQRVPTARPGGSRLVSATAPADGPALAMASTHRPGTGSPSLVALGDIGERVLALAAGAVGDGTPVRLVAVTQTRVLLFDVHCALLASRPLPVAPGDRRVRDPAAVAAIGDLRGGRIGYAVAGRAESEFLSASGDRLERVASIPSGGLAAVVPLAAGGAGPLFGAFLPGRGTLADILSRSPDPQGHPRSGRELFGVAAATRPGRVAYAALGTDFTLRLLGPSLEAVFPDIPAVGVGFALADLDGDGEPEIVASSATPGPSDRVRVLRPGDRSQVIFESPPVEGMIIAGAGADLTGDGIEDAILAAALPSGTTRLWLLTWDAHGTVR